MPRLVDLEPQFIRYVTGIADDHVGQVQPDGSTQWGGFPQEQMNYVDSLAEAQGLKMLCPLCFVKNGGAVGTHGVDVTFADRGVLDHQGSHDSEGKPSRWSVSGTGYADLTTQPSIFLKGTEKYPGCGWHGYITNGVAE